MLHKVPLGNTTTRVCDYLNDNFFEFKRVNSGNI